MENENPNDLGKALLDMSAELFALKVAFITMAKTQPQDVRARFTAAYPANLRTMGDLSLATSHPDTWIAMLEQHGLRLQELIGQ